MPAAPEEPDVMVAAVMFCERHADRFKNAGIRMEDAARSLGHRLMKEITDASTTAEDFAERVKAVGTSKQPVCCFLGDDKAEEVLASLRHKAGN